MTTGEPLGVILELNFRDELERLQAAAEKLGGIAIRVVEDPDEALGLLRARHAARLRNQFPGISDEKCNEVVHEAWSTKRLGEIIGPDARHAVTEITFYENHSLMDLHHTALHGDTWGRTQI